MRAKGRPSVEALKATVEQEWQQLKDIRRRITPAVTAASVRVDIKYACVRASRAVVTLMHDPRMLKLSTVL